MKNLNFKDLEGIMPGWWIDLVKIEPGINNSTDLKIKLADLEISQAT